MHGIEMRSFSVNKKRRYEDVKHGEKRRYEDVKM
jgi:hypothetical protein